MSSLTRERLKQLLEYDPNTGKFTSREARGNVGVGVEVGWESTKGYQRLAIDGERHSLHSLAWFYMTGVYPELVDHKDLDTKNNKWDNLRVATKVQNACNKGLRKDNKLGVKGVSMTRSGAYMVRVNQKSYGCYVDLELAQHIATEVRGHLHGEFARHA